MNDDQGLLGALDRLTLHRFRVDVRFARPLAVASARRATLWRGAFGAVFRSLVCHDVSLACDTCPLRSTCPYPRVFAPAIPMGRLQLARYRDPPRPFVLGDPRPEHHILPKGEPLALGFTLVGRAAADLPYFVVTLRRLGEEGIGRERARFTVDAVRAVDAADCGTDVVYARGDDVVRPASTPLRPRDLERPGDDRAKKVRVHFVTPTDIRRDGEGDGPPSFGALVRRARDRASALATFFGEGALAIDAQAIGAAADGVRTVGEEAKRSGFVRRSARTGQRHPVQGVVGSVVYEGDGVPAAMPWLRIAEVVGVGKHATFGCGRVRVEVLA